nr:MULTISPECIES: tail fiber domain-containing protein [Myxococcaceae]
MWHPFKAAFRAGGVDGNLGHWDDANVGFYSWAGGFNTRASANYSLAFGYYNLASGAYATALGYNTTASGMGSAALGYRVTADGAYGVALGNRVSTNGFDGAFAWGDGSTTTVPSNLVTASNQFAIRAAGGVRLFTNSGLTTGVSLNPGGSSWNVLSDRNAKTAFQPVDGEQVLAKLSKIPLQTWVYKAEEQQPRHVGPMAQDFHAAFGLGLNDRTINSLDIDGINMVAIQALEKRTEELQASTRQVQTLQQEVELLKRQLGRIEQELARQKR